MKPENLVLKADNGDIIRIDSYNDFLSKKPTVRLSCIENDTCTQDFDGNLIEEHSEGTCYLTVETIDQIISKLQEARSFLQ